MRAANDSSGSLNNRQITVTGFILNEPGGPTWPALSSSVVPPTLN